MRSTISLMVCAAMMVTVSVACCGQAAAVEAKVEGGVLKISSGTTAFSLDVAKGVVTVKQGTRTASGKGALLQVSPGEGGKVTVTDLGAAAKAKKPITIGDADLIVSHGTLHQSLPLKGVAVWDVGGGPASLPVPLDALGFPKNAVLAGFDRVGDEFFGPVIGAFARPVGAGQCRLFALGQATDRPMLLCTSSALAAGAGEVASAKWDAGAGVLSGASKVEKDKRHELRIFAPPEPQRWIAEEATAAEAGVTTLVLQTRQWLRVYLESPEAKTVNWKVKFTQKPPKAVAAGAVRLKATAVSPRRVALSCYGIDGDVVIRRNDGAEIVASEGTVEDASARPDTAYTYAVHPLSWTGRRPAVATAKARTPELPPMPPLPNVYLSDLRPARFTNGWNGDPRRDKSIEDNPIRIRGETFARGMGVHALSELVYKVRSNYRRFVAIVGADDEKNDTPSATVTFEVFADDTSLFKSKVLTPRDEMLGIHVAIPKGAKLVRLVVGDGGDGIGCDHADWANAGFITEGVAEPELDVLEPGFTRIFNGKDLTGWDGDPRLWSVHKGILVGETTPAKAAQGNTFLIWRGGQLKDFVLKLKFRIRSRNNSGVQYRSKEIGKWRIGGYQAEVASGAGQVGLLYDEAARQRLASVGEFVVVDEQGAKQVVGQVADKAALIKAGYHRPNDWSEYVITARGNHIVHQLNGHTTIELIDNDPKGGAAEGLLALQLHAGEPMLVEFFDIRLKPLPQTFGKAIRLFNGTDLTGWTHSSPALKQTWGVKDGAITNTGRPAGYVRTTADHTHYVLSLQMRHITPGNSGVLLRMVGPDKVWPRSIEAQGQIGSLGDIWNIDKFPMKTAADRTNGRHTRKAHPSNERPLGQWSTYQITLDGGALEIRVNGLVQNSATDVWETPGKICLQSEGAQTEFRNIVLIPIERAKKP